MILFLMVEYRLACVGDIDTIRSIIIETLQVVSSKHYEAVWIRERNES